MKKLALLALLGIPLISATAKADTLVYDFTANDGTTVIPPTFFATGTSQGLSYGSTAFNAANTAYFGGNATSGDWIYVYTLTNTGLPPDDTIENFEVNSGTSALGLYSSAVGANSSNTYESGGGTIPTPMPYVENFDHLSLSGTSTVTLAFYTTGAPVAGPATVQDGGSGSALPFVVTASGLHFLGTPLPVPASVWGGLGLFGLLATVTLRKRAAAH